MTYKVLLHKFTFCFRQKRIEVGRHLACLFNKLFNLCLKEVWKLIQAVLKQLLMFYPSFGVTVLVDRKHSINKSRVSVWSKHLLNIVLSSKFRTCQIVIHLLERHHLIVGDTSSRNDIMSSRNLFLFLCLHVLADKRYSSLAKRSNTFKVLLCSSILVIKISYLNLIVTCQSILIGFPFQ